MRRLIVCFLMILVAPYLFAEGDLAGKKARDFTLKTLEGKKIKMSEHKGNKHALLFFWTTWCPTCQVVFPKVLEDSKKLEEQGIRLMLINVGDEEKKVRAYVESKQIEVPLLLDSKWKVADSYAVYLIPTFIMVDSKGTILSVSNRLPEDYAQLLQ